MCGRHLPAESGRKAPYTADIRWRVVVQLKDDHYILLFQMYMDSVLRMRQYAKLYVQTHMKLTVPLEQKKVS